MLTIIAASLSIAYTVASIVTGHPILMINALLLAIAAILLCLMKR